MVAWQPVFVMVSLVIGLIVMAFEIFPIDLTLLLLTWIYVPAGIIKVNEAAAGFSSEGLITVMVLFPVAVAIAETGVLNPIQRFFTLGTEKRLAKGEKVSERNILYRISFPMVILSAFYNNTPQVSMFIPVMQDIARKLNIAPSKLMLPLSYTSIVGGCLTLIGTSTNLLAISLAQKARPAEFNNFGQFTLSIVGAPVALVAIFYIAFLGPWILPNRQGTSRVVANPREYVFAATVGDNKGIAGKTIKEARVAGLHKVSLIQLERANGDRIAAPGLETPLLVGDTLWFAGKLDDLFAVKKIPGLLVNGDEPVDLRNLDFGTNVYEAVIAPRSPLIGKSVGNYSFREQYKGAVIAVHRDGVRVEDPLASLELRSGDILLVLAPEEFKHQHSSAPHFHDVFSVIRPAIEKVRNPSPWWKKAVAIVPFLVAVVLSSLDGWTLSLAAGGIFSVAIILFFRIITPDETRQSLDWSVFIAIGTSLGLGSAMTNSGAAKILADALVSLSDSGGEVGLMAAVYVVAVILNAIVSNNASVTLVFPIIDAALKTRPYSMFPFVLILMMAGSADFSTPIGYQTNLMVFAPGGYRFYDYIVFGLPLQILSGIFTVLCTATRQYWWLWTAVLLAINLLAWGMLEAHELLGIRYPWLERVSARFARKKKNDDDLEALGHVSNETLHIEDSKLSEGHKEKDVKEVQVV
ncbi:Phosphoinositide phosphatase sac1 [Rhizophlyctis rosea]|uniref:Phosphoinositide phosphatase sac1 n=1 Tax=Rhizophlyctis rosea TaxID=64517 RepID=A0AAD5X172_9FUNG|nr:Phosphoinositide phosphatase sac1 [Rhizophlyctis rosea]